MERQVSIDVTDYHYPDGDDWSNDLVTYNESMTRPSSPPIYQIPEMENSEYVTVTLDIHEDSVSVVSVTPYRNGGSSSVVVKNPAVERLALPRRRYHELSKALKELKMFINTTDSDWFTVERRFYKMTAKTDGLLIRSKFGDCVGINSEEFALVLFDTLAKRCYITTHVINLEELREFWCQINDRSFDSRLRIFFDMVDKDGDGRLTDNDVEEFIRLTAIANNQYKMENMADVYAALIMEELDPDNLGYIIMEFLELLLLDVESLSVKEITEETKKPTKRWYKVSSLIPCFKKSASTKKS